jgi:hypothetical protein
MQSLRWLYPRALAMMQKALAMMQLEISEGEINHQKKKNDGKLFTENFTLPAKTTVKTKLGCISMHI